MLGVFVYLKFGISFILGFIGLKMLLTSAGVHITIAVSLSVIVATIAVSVLASLAWGRVAQQVPEQV